MVKYEVEENSFHKSLQEIEEMFKKDTGVRYLECSLKNISKEFPDIIVGIQMLTVSKSFQYLNVKTFKRERLIFVRDSNDVLYSLCIHVITFKDIFYRGKPIENKAVLVVKNKLKKVSDNRYESEEVSYKACLFEEKEYNELMKISNGYAVGKSNLEAIYDEINQRHIFMDEYLRIPFENVLITSEDVNNARYYEPRTTNYYTRNVIPMPVNYEKSCG